MSTDVQATEHEALWDSCAAVVKSGVAVFLEVANALGIIHKHELWKIRGHKSFVDCCFAEWGIKKSYAYYLLDVNKRQKIIEADSTCVEKPTTDTQYRALGKLPEAEQSAAWADAVAESGGNPTAKDVERVVKQRISTTKPTPKKFVCPNCGGHELSEFGDCEACKEPIAVEPPAYDVEAATENLDDCLAELLEALNADYDHIWAKRFIRFGSLLETKGRKAMLSKGRK